MPIRVMNQVRTAKNDLADTMSSNPGEIRGAAGHDDLPNGPPGREAGGGGQLQVHRGEDRPASYRPGR